MNEFKSPHELAILFWNTNGKLDLRECRESLVRRWFRKGFVDVGLIQEHFKKADIAMFNLFGLAWWRVSSGAVGLSKGRRSGGCAIFGQPALVTDHVFQHRGGRICGLFTSGGLILNVYFPTKGPRQLMKDYREMFNAFMEELMAVV